MGRMKKPGRINLVSLLLLLALAAVVYGGVQFGPPYWRKYRVGEILSVAGNKVYPRRFNATGKFFDEAEEEAVRKIRQLGVKDRGLSVSIRVVDREIRIVAEYDEHIQHPLIHKTTVLHFRPTHVVKFHD